MSAKRLVLVTVIGLLALLPAGTRSAIAQEERKSTAQREGERFDQLRDEGKFAEAEAYLKELIEKSRRNGDRQYQYLCLSLLVDLYIQLDRIQEALPLAKEALAGCKQHYGPRHRMAGKAAMRLGRVYLQLNRTNEALGLYKEARDILVAVHGNDSDDVNYVDGLTASALAHLGRFQEAERVRLRTLTWERRQSAGRPTLGVALELNNLGVLYYKQARHKDAEALLRESCEVLVKAGEGRSLYHAYGLNALADVYRAMLRTEQAVQTYRQSYALYADLLGKDHPLASVQSDLADACTLMKKFDEAEALFKTSLDSASTHYGPESSEAFEAKSGLLMLYCRQLKWDVAQRLSDELLKFAEQPHIPRGTLKSQLTLSAIVARGQDKFDLAAEYGARSIELLEEERARLSGGEQQRAQSGSAGHAMYTMAADDHIRSHQLAKGFALLEQGRGRTLLDQMAIGHVDLFAGMPPEQAQRLRRAYEAIQIRTSDLERRIAALEANKLLSDAEIKQQIARLGEELQASRKQQTEAYSFIRNESPALRRVCGKSFAGAALDEVKAYVKREDALLMYYIVAPSQITLLLSDGSDEIDLVRCEPPGLDDRDIYGGSHIEELLVNKNQSGVVQLLADPKSERALIPKLNELSRILLPKTVRELLKDRAFRRLIIVPDGQLALLPFEALVVEEGPEVKYLLDVAPPINYAPSMTILMNLQQRAATVIPADRDPVLTVGDPAYGPTAATQNNQTAAIDRTFLRRGGELSRLPFSGLEAGWVAETFNKHDQKATLLRDRTATEAAIRAAAPNRRIVHLACHGLADDVTDNFFAALALAPGNAAKTNPRDDGFLTLSELYELDLRACELAILSACQTNYGPQHDGEGVWALSRSFLVAGSRRVVASNWLVDDKAGASLISYFCGAIVKQPTDETDYAKALTEAKRWTRGQEQWRHPYYWATFVLIGPR